MSQRSRKQKKEYTDVSNLVGAPLYKTDYPNGVQPLYWTTTAWNQSAYDFFFRQLCGIAMNRFKWIDLPPEVDSWFLEQTLLYCGMATISAPPDMDMVNAFAMQVVTKGNPNANYEFKRWTAWGYDGLHWDCTPDNGVIVYDNFDRVPIVAQLQFIASECANIMRTKQTVRQHMRQPIILTAPNEMKQQLVNLTSQIGNGQPYIVTYNNFATDVNVTPLNVSNGHESSDLPALQADLKDVWNMGLAFLGITTGEKKMERQSVPEIQQENNPTSLQALNSLAMRRNACEKLNELTGLNTRVVWNADNQSDNYNVMNNLATILSAPNGDDMINDSADVTDSEGNVA